MSALVARHALRAALRVLLRVLRERRSYFYVASDDRLLLVVGDYAAAYADWQDARVS